MLSQMARIATLAHRRSNDHWNHDISRKTAKKYLTDSLFIFYCAMRRIKGIL